MFIHLAIFCRLVFFSCNILQGGVFYISQVISLKETAHFKTKTIQVSKNWGTFLPWNIARCQYILHYFTGWYFSLAIYCKVIFFLHFNSPFSEKKHLVPKPRWFKCLKNGGILSVEILQGIDTLSIILQGDKFLSQYIVTWYFFNISKVFSLKKTAFVKTKMMKNSEKWGNFLRWNIARY